MSTIEQRARQALADALRIRNESRLADMAEIPQGLDQIATHVAIAAICVALTPPKGYALVPAEPTEAMVAAAEDAYMPFGDMALALQMAIAARPEQADE